MSESSLCSCSCTKLSKVHVAWQHSLLHVVAHLVTCRVVLFVGRLVRGLLVVVGGGGGASASSSGLLSSSSSNRPPGSIMNTLLWAASALLGSCRGLLLACSSGTIFLVWVMLIVHNGSFARLAA